MVVTVADCLNHLFYPKTTREIKKEGHIKIKKETPMGKKSHHILGRGEVTGEVSLSRERKLPPQTPTVDKSNKKNS